MNAVAGGILRVMLALIVALGIILGAALWVDRASRGGP